MVDCIALQLRNGCFLVLVQERQRRIHGYFFVCASGVAQTVQEADEAATAQLSRPSLTTSVGPLLFAVGMPVDRMPSAMFPVIGVWPKYLPAYGHVGLTRLGLLLGRRCRGRPRLRRLLGRQEGALALVLCLLRRLSPQAHLLGLPMLTPYLCGPLLP